MNTSGEKGSSTFDFAPTVQFRRMLRILRHSAKNRITKTLFFADKKDVDVTGRYLNT
jgi:hypothetical protein